MGKMIQLRDVPEDLHRTLKARAAEEGRSLSEYLIGEIRLVAERPTPAELRRRLASRSRVRTSRPVAELVREERERR